MPDAVDTLKTKRTLEHDGVLYEYFSLPEAARHIGDVSHLPFSLKVVLENLLRHEDGGRTVAVRDIEALSVWLERCCSSHEGRQVRRVPRRRTAATFPARPGHHRQYGAGIRGHLRHLPH